MPKSPQVALLNFPIEKTPKGKKRLIHFIFLGAKLTIARAWKGPFVSCAMAKGNISWIMAQEKMVSILEDATRKFEAIWEPWVKYMHILLILQ